MTVKLNAVPTIALAGADTEKCVAGGGGATVMVAEPVMLAVTVSVAVTVWLGAVLRVMENVPPPLVNWELPGKTAAPSLLLKWTVPV